MAGPLMIAAYFSGTVTDHSKCVDYSCIQAVPFSLDLGSHEKAHPGFILHCTITVHLKKHETFKRDRVKLSGYSDIKI